MAETRMTKLSDFDLDFSYGLQGESLVNELLTGGKTVEVKRDRRWKDTGNVYIEVNCWSNEHKAWVDSGLMVSKADYWAFVLEEMVVLVSLDNLVKTVHKRGKPALCDIPPNNSRGYLIKVSNLVEISRGLE